MIIRNSDKRKLWSSKLDFEDIRRLSHEIAKKVISGELTKEEAIVEVMDKANWSYGYADAAVSSWIENEPTYNGMVMSSFTLHYKNDDGEDSVWGIYDTKEEAESEIEKFRTTGFGPNPTFCEIIESSRKPIKSSTYQFVCEFDGKYEPRVISHIGDQGVIWEDADENYNNAASFSESELPAAVRSIVKNEDDYDDIEIVKDNGDSVFIKEFIREGSFDNAWQKAVEDEENWFKD